MNIDELITAEKTRRDGWGRYLVVPPEGGKPRGYTRATTVAKALDDGGGLLTWGKRMVALGLARSPHLVAQVATTDPKDKRALNVLCERAAEAGGSTVRRDQGIALHAALEVAWQDPEAAPGMFLEDVRAVHRALDAAGLRPVEGLAERIVVIDEHHIAGTFDLVLTDGTTNYVADVKTGASLIGSLAFAIQLSLYASATAMYVQGRAEDGSEDQRLPMPELDRSAGIIIHVQPDSAVCDLHWIDLEVGAEALGLALDVRAMRKAKPLTKIEGSVAAEAVPDEQDEAVERIKAAFPGAEEIVGEEWRGWFRERLADISEAGHMQLLRQLWPEGVATLASGASITLSEAQLLEAMAEEVERREGLSFPRPKPASLLPKRSEEWLSRIVTPDTAPVEGGQAGAETVAAVQDLARNLDDEARAWLGDVLKAATKAKRPIRISGNGGEPTRRRAAICHALTVAAPLGADLATAVAETAGGRSADKGIAHLVGGFSIEQAERMTALASATHKGQIAAHFQLDGSVALDESDVAQALAA